MCSASMHTQWLQSCNPVDHNPPCSYVHGILQAWILGWVTMPPSMISSLHRDRTHISCIAGGFFTTEPLENPSMCSTGVNSFATFYFFQNEVLIFQSSLSWKFSSFKTYFLALKIFFTYSISIISRVFLIVCIKYEILFSFSFNFTLDQSNWQHQTLFCT